ncbi:hypothetical protein N7541_004221 [Penicillium brevicompactum]|uniref:Zn(2)-C6 fungal-type domain-containing protein n=1 Tax=Penicillium brevicompactum TaxID=5074 RepID=A0A9W9RNG6_PENBR|nr:hypothetical protein N7541_004221 [Penicillium brevicompactum]
MSKSSSDGSPQLNGPLLPNQKVRTTCNACQQAKIRCSHTHPCDRCVSHGFECVYSISQPLGRPAKKKGSRPTQGLQSGRTEGEAAGRPLRRGALGAPKIVTAARLVTARTRQRLPRQRVAPESSPEARGGFDVGTEVTGRDGDLIVPGVMETAVEIPETVSSGDQCQGQESSSADEANNNVGPGTEEQSLDSDDSFVGGDWPWRFDFQGYPHPSQTDYSLLTEHSTPFIGLMLDEPPMSPFVDGDPNALHEAAPGITFDGEASYAFCLAPNAGHISETVHEPWRIMELPSNKTQHGKMETGSSQSPSAGEIDCGSSELLRAEKKNRKPER